MTANRERTFEHEDRKLIVKAFPHGRAWTVRVFEHGKPVTDASYSVSHETAIDAMPIDLVDHLMEIAEGDVKRGWVPLKK